MPTPGQTAKKKMTAKERRRHFLINKPLQFRYMMTISLALLLVLFVSLAHLYFGIWSGVLDAFSDVKIQNDLLTASRIQEYEDARHPSPPPEESFSLLRYFRQAERLSERQQEIFKQLLNETNQNLWGLLIFLLVLIAWGTVFLSHKIAGPLFRFQKVFESVAQGNLAVRCHLRKYDEAKTVADSANEGLTLLDSSIGRMKEIVRQDSGNIDRLVARLKEELSKFKTSGDISTSGEG